MGVEDQYSRGHCHPSCAHWVEVVGYVRDDGRCEVYVFESETLPPGVEAHRRDESHVYFETIGSCREIDRSVGRIHAALGSGWEPVEYLRERGSRRAIGRVYGHLKAHGKAGWVLSEGDHWVLVIRRKDFELAAEVGPPDPR